MKLSFFKTLFFLALSVFATSVVFAQTELAPKVIYQYDNARNRVLRRVIYLGERLADTTATEETTQEPPVFEDGSIAAYPNPTVGVVNISISPNLLEPSPLNPPKGEKKGAGYLLVDLAGKVVRQGTITQSKTVLDISAAANGNYILTVFVGERREEWQIIKQ